MRNITLAIFVAFASLVNAATYYVDGSRLDDSGDGLSWATAKNSINSVITLAKADTVADIIYIKAGTYNLSAQMITGYNDNYYGGFAGTESSPEDRAKSDLDDNGVIDPWEFTTPTVLFSNYTSNISNDIKPAFDFGTTLSDRPVKINGFTFTHIPSFLSSMAQRTISISSSWVVFENNTIRDCYVLSTQSYYSGNYGTLVNSSGKMKSCLIEKNTIYVSTTGIDKNAVPGIALNGRSKLLGCVVRYNSATSDYSLCTSTTAINVQGLIVNPGRSAGGQVMIANCLIYNNEGTYIPKIDGTVLIPPYSAIVTLSTGVSTSLGLDSIVNCIIANNKSTNLASAGLYVRRANGQTHTILNNVLWNNKTSTDVIRNFVFASQLNPPSPTSAKNNIMNAGGFLDVQDGTFISNNLFDLSDTNTGIKGPNFKAPTVAVGISEQADKAVWSIESDSYLKEKGIKSSVLTDFNGTPYASIPSVGAYEYIASNGLKDLKTVSNIVLVSNKAIVSKIKAQFTVYSVSGQVVNRRYLSEGEQIQLNAGVYFIHASINGVSSIQKVVI